MKKINLLVLIVGLLVGLSSAGYAEIGKGVDSFDGTTFIYSRIKDVGPFNFVNFFRMKTQKGATACFLVINRVESEWWFFGNVPLEMKIAEKIYDLPICKTDSKMLFTYALYTVGRWTVSKKMDERILKADSITIRVHYSNQPSTTWKVPSKMLNEWKQVIKKKF